MRTNFPPAELQSLVGKTPIEVAQKLHGRSGTVFFDSAGHINGAGERSFLGIEPQQILRGKIDNREHTDALRQALQESGKNAGLGGLCGWVDYEGNFVFGDFPELLCHLGYGRWIGSEALAEKILSAPDRDQDQASTGIHLGEPQAELSRAQFISLVEQARQEILHGRLRQLNLAYNVSLPAEGSSLWKLYEILRTISPAPMASYLNLDESEILSSSPELFIKIVGNTIETRPIKGTRPRGKSPVEEARMVRELWGSKKEQRELALVTNLAKQELESLCSTVKIVEPRRLEILEQVHHALSVIKGNLRNGIGPIDVLESCLPAASIAGVPKQEAQQLIAKLEDRKRGLYCGVIGYILSSGESQFSTAIRTMVRDKNRLHFAVGAGIVHDSVPDQEYEETLQKAEGIYRSIRQFSAL